jgi:hypothetical protein
MKARRPVTARRRPWLYFADFVVSFSLGVICLVVFHRSTDWLIAMGSGVIAGLAIYRCSIFIHEIQHHPEQELRTFSRAWNACFGIPCLMPLFVYDEHVAHHSVASYGTHEDSEYLPLRPARLVRSMALMAVSVLYPLLGPLRFAVFTPLALVSRRMNRFVFTVMSSLYNLKPGYRRAWVAAAESPSRWFQEIACCLWAWGWIAAGVMGVIPPSVFWKTYVLFVLWMALNQLRTLTAHRYDGDGSPQGSLSQLLDSNTFDRGPAIPRAPSPSSRVALSQPRPCTPQAHKCSAGRLPVPPDTASGIVARNPGQFRLWGAGPDAGTSLHARYRTARTPGIDRTSALVAQLSPNDTLNTIRAFDVAGIDEPRSTYCVHTTKG